MTAAARDGSAAREDLSGSTITLTSLGPLGGIAATPIINHPEVAIIGPNKLTERPVIEGAFLNGKDTPTVEMGEFEFDQLGFATRAYFDFGVNKQEYRAGVKLKGAA